MDFGKCAERFADLRHTILFTAHGESNEGGLSSPICRRKWACPRSHYGHESDPAVGVGPPSQFSRAFFLVQGAFSHPAIRRGCGLRLHFSRTALPQRSWPSAPISKANQDPRMKKFRADLRPKKRERSPEGRHLKPQCL